MASCRKLVLGALVLLSMSAVASAADDSRGAVELSGGNIVSQNPSLPKLELTAEQREQIRRTLLTRDTDIEFRLPETKAAKDFTPQVGAGLPKGVTPDGLPSELTEPIPQLANYGYAKMKDKILVVNALTGKIVEIIPTA